MCDKFYGVAWKIFFVDLITKYSLKFISVIFLQNIHVRCRKLKKTKTASLEDLILLLHYE